MDGKREEEEEEEDAAAPAMDVKEGEGEEEEDHIAQEHCDGPSPQRHNPSNVFILAGQSNMSGRGGVRHKRWDRVVPPECRPRPAILRFSARSRWVEAREPLHADIDSAKTCGVGPGMAFADAVLPHLLPDGSSAADEAAVVGLVPCAVGGTAIREWERGTGLYAQMLRRAKEAVRWGGEVRALLWYQGESDTGSPHAADAYGANMERLIRDIRADLGLPSLPFIQASGALPSPLRNSRKMIMMRCSLTIRSNLQVAIASGDQGGACMEKVRQAQLGMTLPNVVCVDAKGLPLNEDHLHLSTEAQLRLGSMLAEAYVKNFLAVGVVARAPPSLPSCP